MQSSDYDIEALNDLIATMIDSVESAQAASHGDAAPIDDRMQHRAVEVSRLQDYVQELGGVPAMAGGASAPHRLFAGMREDAGMGEDERLAADMERDEDQLAAKLERALSDADLAPRTRDLIGDVLSSLRDDDELKLAA